MYAALDGGHSTSKLIVNVVVMIALRLCAEQENHIIVKSKYVGVVFLDISKAFDTVNHDLLLSKLSYLGLSLSTASWFKSYLSNRLHVTWVADSNPLLGFPCSLNFEL